MARQMQYTDNRGATFPTSYWKLVNLNINTLAKEAQLVFLGFVDKAARDANKEPVAVKGYIVTGEAFTQAFGNEAVNAYSSAYDYALACPEQKQIMSATDPTVVAVPEIPSFFSTSTEV